MDRLHPRVVNLNVCKSEMSLYVVVEATLLEILQVFSTTRALPETSRLMNSVMEDFQHPFTLQSRVI